MIERAARWLKIGERAAFQENKNRFRSRRHLHSAFWSHGAGNIDLPAWWIFLLQTPSKPSDGSIGGTSKAFRTAVSRKLENIFLDFLYPSRTRALIKRLKRATSAHQHAAQNVQSYSRSYTTIAQDLIIGADAPSVTAETCKKGDHLATVPLQSEETLRRTINSILDAKDHYGLYDQLWQNYQDLSSQSLALSPHEMIRMLRCLVSSELSLNYERALALFESIPVGRRRAIHYSHAVSAALVLKDIDTAVSIHREALSSINGSIGTAAILGYAVQHELWTVAVDIFYHFWENKLLYYTRPDIWTAIHEIPLNELLVQASSAANFALKASEGSNDKEAIAAREFALEFIRHTFSITNTEFDLKSHTKLVRMVRSLGTADDSIRTLALEQLLSRGSREHDTRAFNLYWNLRKLSTISPSRSILDKITPMVFERRLVFKVILILDDWRTHFSTTPPQYALAASRVFARNGLLEENQKLFENYVSEHGKPNDEVFYDNLLLTYARRVDTEGVVHFFNRLKEFYDFRPSTLSWNCVLSAFARAGDIDGILVQFRKLREAGIQPDSTTYFLMMSIYGRRGDREAVEGLLAQSKEEGVEITTRMIDQLVLANVKEGNLLEAERLVEQVQSVAPGRPCTFMWNVLINAHALRKSIDKVSQLHRRMQELRVPFDNMTYAALMTSLTVLRNPLGARKIFKTIMPQHNLKPTAVHFAILMGVYNATKQYGKVFELHEEMVRPNVKPTMNTQKGSKVKPTMGTRNALLRAAGALDKSANLIAPLQTEELELPRARQIFEEAIANLDPSELAPTEPRKYVGPGSLQEAFFSSYYEYLILLYGTENAVKRASELYDRYIAAVKPLQTRESEVEFIPPVRLLSALMVSHLRARKYDKLESCWNLALEKCERLACKSRADTFRHAWVLHSHRFIINQPLHQYILSLREQRRIEDLIDTISDLLRAGYALHSANWNRYIQTLARSPQLVHRRLAFRFCEQELTSSFPGWDALGSNPYYLKERLNRQQRHMMLMQDEKAPTYITLLLLAKAYVAERDLDGTEKAREHYHKMYPKTIEVIETIPRCQDREQRQILSLYRYHGFFKSGEYAARNVTHVLGS